MRLLTLLLAIVSALVWCGERIAHETKAHAVGRIFAPQGVAPKTSDAPGPIVVDRFVGTLRSQGRPIPTYLRLVSEELEPAPRETATFAVGCYWEGERELGRMRGVMSARTGTLEGREVVRVRFDPAVVDRIALADRLSRLPCYRGTVPAGGRLAALDDRNQQHFHLFLHPEYYYLPLTERQAMRLDSALASDENADDFLSPLQLSLKRRLAETLSLDPTAIDELRDLTPDRSLEGLPEYLRALERLVED